MADGELPTHAKRSTCAKGSLVLHSPSLSRLDPWSWERPSLWGLVDGGWGSVRVMGGGWGRGEEGGREEEEGGREVLIVSTVLVSTAVCALMLCLLLLVKCLVLDSGRSGGLWLSVVVCGLFARAAVDGSAAGKGFLQLRPQTSS